MKLILRFIGLNMTTIRPRYLLTRKRRIIRSIGKVKVVKLGVLVLAICTSFFSQAADEEAIRSKLTNMLGLKVNTIADAPLPGLVQVTTDRGLFYVSDDAKYLVQAHIYNIDKGMRDETEAALASLRVKGADEFASSSITYKAKDEKYVISVFTDITCGYCRKLHNEVGALNDAGVTVQYLAFPRAGINSEVYQDMVSVWCADDPNDALTSAKNGGAVTAARCENKVAEQYMFGKTVGVTGTPNIVLPNGEVIPGYLPATQIVSKLKRAG
jgi:thiol:disulfide interchange protein DsbC